MPYELYKQGKPSTSAVHQLRPCWICEPDANNRERLIKRSDIKSDANTREHLIKRSDIKSEFPNISQNDYLNYKDGWGHKPKRIGSPDANVLKFNGKICHSCNNSLTQPHDKAWESLSQLLRTQRPAISAGDTIFTRQVFPSKTKQMMLNVHLYFIKQFGCHIVEKSIPISLTAFRSAIRQNKAHPDVYLKFVDTASFGNSAGVSQIYRKADDSKGKGAAVIWLYRVGRLGVAVLFCSPGCRREVLKEYYHPKSGWEKLTFYNFDENVSHFFAKHPSAQHVPEHRGISITRPVAE